MHNVSMMSNGQTGGSRKQQQSNSLGFPEHTSERTIKNRSVHITKGKSELINHREHKSNKITINTSRPTRVDNTSGSVTFRGLGGILPKAGKAAGGYVIFVPDKIDLPAEVREEITAEMASLHEIIPWIENENMK